MSAMLWAAIAYAVGGILGFLAGRDYEKRKRLREENQGTPL